MWKYKNRRSTTYQRWMGAVYIVAGDKSNPRLDFTHTLEADGDITYLDLIIHRCTHNIQLSIHRKPTQTDTTFHYTSNHPMQYNLAAYIAYIHRMLSFPITDQARRSEWETICTIARNNGFPTQLIHNTRHKILHKRNAPSTETRTHRETWVTFTYRNPLVHKITSLFKNTNINIAFRSTNTLYHYLQNYPSTDKLRANGIYRLQCNTCAKSYVGQSGRSFSVCHKEHKVY
jgi:hypothetical protein